MMDGGLTGGVVGLVGPVALLAVLALNLLLLAAHGRRLMQAILGHGPMARTIDVTPEGDPHIVRGAAGCNVVPLRPAASMPRALPRQRLPLAA